MFKLIRDKVPEIVKEAGQICNFATAENDEFYSVLLREKLIEETNEFLTSGSLEELIDVVTVIRSLFGVLGISEEDFETAYQQKLESKGGFEKRYIGFFPDRPHNLEEAPAPESENN